MPTPNSPTIINQARPIRFHVSLTISNGAKQRPARSCFAFAALISLPCNAALISPPIRAAAADGFFGKPRMLMYDGREGGDQNLGDREEIRIRHHGTSVLAES